LSIFQLRNVGLCHGENQGTHPETDIIRALYNLWCSDRGSLRTAYGCPAHRATPGSEAFSSRGRGNEAQQNDKQPVSPRRFFAQTDYPAPETLELYRKRTGATISVSLDHKAASFKRLLRKLRHLAGPIYHAIIPVSSANRELDRLDNFRFDGHSGRTSPVSGVRTPSLSCGVAPEWEPAVQSNRMTTFHRSAGCERC